MMATQPARAVSPRQFATPSQFRAWLERNHRNKKELLVKFAKRSSGLPCMTWAESAAEALCFGWVDGVRKRWDDDHYVIRFTPRKAKCIWSAVNIRLFAELEAAGRMSDAGREAFSVRSEKRSRVYSYEQTGNHTPALDAASVREFKKYKAAWDFFQSTPPSYRNKVIWWVVGAKSEATRTRRIAKLIHASANKQRLG